MQEENEVKLFAATNREYREIREDGESKLR